MIVKGRLYYSLCTYCKKDCFLYCLQKTFVGFSVSVLLFIIVKENYLSSLGLVYKSIRLESLGLPQATQSDSFIREHALNERSGLLVHQYMWA